MRNAEFTFEDFLEQMEQVKKLGPIDQLLDMLPGANKMKGMKDLKVDDKQMGRVVAIVKSMTKEEKLKPELLNASRRKRIAAGSGTSIQDVNRLIKQFDDMRKMMKQFSSMMGPGGPKGMKNMKKLGKGGGFKFPFG
jgi:signal recognition particle subunit SRP54